MVNISYSDKRISLVSFENKKIILKEKDTFTERIFEIEDEAGRGGSCITYKASIINNKGEKFLPVLLKEFYPVAFTGNLRRDKNTHALIFNGSDREDFLKTTNTFEKMCRDQNEFYLNNPNYVDDLVAIYGIYNLGDVAYAMMSSAGGRTWNIDSSQESLLQILEITLSIVRQLKIYFSNNLLHLDIKPENIYVSNNLRNIKIIDFGSVQKMHKGSLQYTENIFSYTLQYAAPEVLELVDKTGRDVQLYSQLVTPKSDLFSVSAVLFKKISGECYKLQKEERDKILDKLWTEGRFKHIPKLFYCELKRFFDLTLAKKPKDRLNREEMEDALSFLIRHVPPDISLSAEMKAVHPTEKFFGREKELALLNQLLDIGKSPIYLSGNSGLGKTQLALKLAFDRRNDYECYYVSFNENLEKTILSLRTNPPFFNSDSKPKDPKALYDWNMNCLRAHGDTILLIDNFNLSPEDMQLVLCSADYANLKRLNITIIFTCRYRPPLQETCVEVKELEYSELLKLMKTYYKDYESENELIELIKIAEKNTFLVETMARNLGSSLGEITPQKILEQMQQGSGTIYDKIKNLFNVSNLRNRAKKILCEATLFPNYGINSVTFLRCHNEDDSAQIKLLEQSGWLKYSDKFLSIHPLVRKVCFELLPQYNSECENFVHTYNKTFEDLPEEEWQQQWHQRLVIFAHAADLLEDSQGYYAKKVSDWCFINYDYSDSLIYCEKFREKFLLLNPNPNPIEMAELMSRMSSIAQFATNSEKSFTYANEALNYAEKVYDDDILNLFPYYLSVINAQIICGDERYLENYINLINFLQESNFEDETVKADILDMKSLVNAINLDLDYVEFIKIFKKMKDKNYELFSNTAMPLELRCTACLNATRISVFIGNYEEALRLVENSLEFIEDNCNEIVFPTLIIQLQLYNIKSFALMKVEKYEEAFQLLKKTLKEAEKTLGNVHAITSETYSILAIYFQMQDDIPQAILYCQKALQSRELLGDNNIIISATLDLLTELQAE